MNGYIYKISNDINNLVYIGLTHKKPEERWDQHLNCANGLHGKMFDIHKAIQQLGKEHFKFEVIETVELTTPTILQEREVYWISYYDSYKNGYNMTIGGEGGKYTIDDVKLWYQLWQDGLMVNQIVEQTGASRDAIIDHLTLIPGWQEANQVRANKYSNQIASSARKISIDVYDLKGNFIKTYDSCQEACHELGLDASSVSSCLSTNSSVKRVKEYQIVYHNDKAPGVYGKTGSIPIDQYDLQGNFLATYANAHDAARALGYKETKVVKQKAKAIRESIRDPRRQTAYGYIWKEHNDGTA